MMEDRTHLAEAFCTFSSVVRQMGQANVYSGFATGSISAGGYCIACEVAVAPVTHSPPAWQLLRTQGRL